MYRATDADATSVEAGEVALSELPLEHLEHEICELAAHIGAGMARWIALVDEYDRRDGWGSWRGVRSCAEWIAWRCSCSPRMAREHLRVARALRDLPKTREAFSAGELSYSKVRSLTRVATADSEEFLLHQATYATASQLDRMLGAYRHSVAADEAETEDPRELSWSWCPDGSLQISARLPADEGRAFLDALESARTHIREEERAGGEEDGPAGPSSDGAGPLLGSVATNADALSLIAESFLEHGPAVRAGPDRQHLVIHVDAETLAGDGDGRSELERGPRIPPETARRLGCDASLQVLVKRGREALFVGRRTRAISPALNLALRERDRCCRFPGCDNHRWLDAHHIVHWALGGETSLENLILLCRRHHRLLHEGGFSMERLRDGELLFRDSYGRQLRDAPKMPRGSLQKLRAWNSTTGLEIDHDTILTGTGERMDLHANVDAVWAACEP